MMAERTNRNSAHIDKLSTRARRVVARKQWSFHKLYIPQVGVEGALQKEIEKTRYE